MIAISVHCNDTSVQACRLAWGRDANAAAVAHYNRTTNLTSGFATLDIASPAGVPLRLAAFAAGVAEGYQTAAEIAELCVAR
eukprot:1598226-Prymnesium_polylepis.1